MQCQNIKDLNIKRGNASPKGRPRVFFCCHPDNHERLIEPIMKEILDIQLNAAIWYYDPKEGIPQGDLFFADLAEMQLFVVPVTANFLYRENSARSVEFAFAIEHHIPILPLMQEPGLENDFNTICGNLHFLDKHTSSIDPTALPYEEKLKKYLESVLVNDELAQKIRDAFDAYTFLSYRKKDRKYAREIMRLIHKNDFCRDIAIWYDEFLTPGENFNDAIKEAMEKSSLFAMVVTPSLLENPNYVMSVEYPEAKKNHKPILPIEGQETDSSGLSELYPDIPDVVNEHALAEKLHNILYSIALEEKDGDPTHTFLIGLAYLSGIDVEVDHERALTMISSAAEAGVPEAYDKLVSMYQNGEGVERNYNTAIEWQKRFVDFFKLKYEELQYDAVGEVYFKTLMDLGNYQAANGQLQDAEATYRVMLDNAKTLSKFPKSYPIHLAAINDRLGYISESQGHLDEAKKFYLKAMDINMFIADDMRTVEAYQNLSASYDGLGRISEAQSHLEEAKEWYLKSMEISRLLAEETETTETSRDLFISYTRVSSKTHGKFKRISAGR